MRWRTGRRSAQVEDRRGRRVGRVPGGMRVGGGAALLVLLVVMLLGGDPSQLLRLLGEPSAASPQTRVAPPSGDEAGEFVSTMLGSTEDVWNELFARGGGRYQLPTLVLFTDAVQSACGYNTAATGPFYCPADRQVYLDLGFFRQLARLGGPGDFAQAYVIGHEVAHHVQNLLGTSSQVSRLQRQASRAEANALSMMLELQADCYAGVWAHHANRQWLNQQGVELLEPGDVEEGLAAAAAIGDDRLMRDAGRRVSPESFTHGTSAQRAQWLRRGMETGNVEACDTFSSGGR